MVIESFVKRLWCKEVTLWSFIRGFVVLLFRYNGVTGVAPASFLGIPSTPVIEKETPFPSLLDKSVVGFPVWLTITVDNIIDNPGDGALHIWNSHTST